MVTSLERKYGNRLVSAVVFGSVARGEMRKDSDIEVLLIIKSLPKSRLKRQEEFLEVEGEVEEEISKLSNLGYFVDFSPIMKTPEEAKRISPLYLDTVEDAVIVLDRNSFFQEILRRLRDRLRQLGSKKIRMGKKWYWILKTDYQFGEVIEIE